MYPITVRGLTKSYRGKPAVDGLDFDAAPGRVTGFLGPNGAGKTTTLRILLGLASADAGTATIGADAYRALGNPTAVIGTVLDQRFHPGRTARNHLRVYSMAGNHDAHRIDDLLELVGLTDAANQRVKGFSLGMKQRLAIATALLGDPPVLVLDEPANGLDPEGMIWLRNLLRAQAAEGRTVLISSHVLSEMAQTIDDAVVISNGQLRAQAPLTELTAGVSAALRIRSPNLAGVQQVAGQYGLPVRQVAADAVEIDGATGEQLGIPLANAGIPIFEMSVQGQNLEALYLSLVGAQLPPPPQAAHIAGGIQPQ